MKKKFFSLMTLAIIVIGVIHYSLHRESQTHIPLISEKNNKNDESLELVVRDILNEVEKTENVKLIKREEKLFIETDIPEIENIIKNNKIAIDKKVIVIRTNDLLLFKRGNESFSVKIINREEPAHLRPKLAIIIDDIGNSKELGEELFKIKGLTYSILPNLPYSNYFAEMGKRQGKEIMLHIPMEPKDNSKYSNDDNLLKVSMSAEEIIKLTENYIKSLDGVRGVNNHMGSKFTEDEVKMRVFLNKLKEKNLFFLDSRTSPDSKGYEIAKEIGVKSYRRDFFLDHNVDEFQIKEQLDKAVSFAIQNGFAIAIGHPHKETIKVLKEKLPEISKSVDLVPLSNIR